MNSKVSNMEKTKYHFRSVTALAALICFAYPAVAQTEPVTNTAKIQAVSEERALLEAEVKRAESRKKLHEIQASNLGPSAAVGRPVGSSPAVGRIEAEQEMGGYPTVSYVEGRKGDLEAVLVFRNGAKQRVKAGDKVIGTTVHKISLNEVSLMDPNSKAAVRLQFANPTTQGQNPAQFQGASSPGGAPVPIVPMPSGVR